MKRKILIITSGNNGLQKWHLKKALKRSGFQVEKHTSNAFELKDITYFFFDVTSRNFKTFIKKHPEVDRIYIDKTLGKSFAQEHGNKIRALVHHDSNKVRVVSPHFDYLPLFKEHPSFCSPPEVFYVLENNDSEIKTVSISPLDFIEGRHFSSVPLAKTEVILRANVRLKKLLQAMHVERELIEKMQKK